MVQRYLLIFLVAGAVWAQPAPTPPPGPGGPGGPGEKHLKGMFNWPRQGLPYFPAPFLIAGDARFEKMIRLVFLPEDQMLQAVEAWPESKDLPPEVREQLPKRLVSFRDRMSHEALKAAEEWEIPLAPEMKPQFVRAYWEERIRMEREIRQRAQAELDQRSAGLKFNLQSRFGAR